MTKIYGPEPSKKQTSLQTNKAYRKMSASLHQKVSITPPESGNQYPEYPFPKFRTKQKAYSMIYLKKENLGLKLADLGILLKLSSRLPINETVCSEKGRPLNTRQLYDYLAVQSTSFSDFLKRAKNAKVISVEKNQDNAFENVYHVMPAFARRGFCQPDQLNEPFVKLILQKASLIQLLTNQEAGFLYYLMGMMHQDFQLLSPVPFETAESHVQFHNRTSLAAELKRNFNIKSIKTVRSYLKTLEKSNILKSFTYNRKTVLILNPNLFVRASFQGGKGLNDAIELFKNGRISPSLLTLIS